MERASRCQPQDDARVARSRASLRAALLALLDRQRFEDLTVRAITARAGVGYATFFRHYPDKHDLLHDVAAAAIGELLARAMPIAAADDSRGACLVLCQYVHSQRRLWRALLNGGAAAMVRDEFLRQARAMVPAQPPPPAWLPADLAVTVASLGTLEVFAWWLAAKRPLSIEQVAEILDRLVIAAAVGRSTASLSTRRKKADG
jgi:AcrR family transcriptional regulator